MVEDVILSTSIPHFAEALLGNIPYWYVFLEKRSADMKLGNKKCQYGILAYTGPFRALIGHLC
jgi:hypothetical protein